MADDQEPRVQPPDGDGELDQTRPHDPVDDTVESAGPGSSGPSGSSGSSGPSGSSGSSGSDDTVVVPRGDDTAIVPRGDDTAVLPPPGRDRWTARAGIPPAAPPRPPEPYDRDQEGRGWWVPAVLALLGLVLLAVLAIGVYLILRSRGEPVPAPSASPSPTTVSPKPSPTPSPTTPSPTPSQPVPVRVPPLVGLTQADAQQVLDTVGLTYRVEERVDPNSQPGRVIAVNPAEGALVPPGSRVMLVVAVAPPTTAAPSPTPSATPPGRRR